MKMVMTMIMIIMMIALEPPVQYLSATVGQQDPVLSLGGATVTVLHVAEHVTRVVILHVPGEIVRHPLHSGSGCGGLSVVK